MNFSFNIFFFMNMEVVTIFKVVALQEHIASLL